MVIGAAGHPRPQRLPDRAVPAGDVVGADAAGGFEPASRDQLAVVDPQGGNVDWWPTSGHPGPQQLPVRAVPAGNVVRAHAAGGGEPAARDQLAVVDRQGPDHGVHPRPLRPQRVPSRTVPPGNVVARHAAGGVERAARD